MRPAYWIAALLLAGGLAGGWLLGVFSDGVIEGRVRDDRGPLPGARVCLRGGPATVTDADGRFRLPALADPAARLMVAREGYLLQGFPKTAASSPLVLARLPADHAEYAWIEPGPKPPGAFNCVNCHAEIYREWQGSAHARAADNRRFFNLYDGTDWHGRPHVGWSLKRDNPDGAGVCAACHAPTVSAGDPAFADLGLVRGVDRRGVHCDFCHKIAGAAVDERGLTFGRFGYQLARPERGQLFFGPLDDAERPGESFSYAPVYRESRYCASCHEGVVFGVPVYTTYSEWLASPARRQGKQCQSCHMTPTGRLANVAPGKGGIDRDPHTLGSHRVPGGQADMLRGCLSVSARLARGPGGLTARVRLTAQDVGHRVPTGFIDRNLVLVVEGLDRAGKALPLVSGPVLPGLAGKGYAGRAGRLFAKQLADEDRRHPLPFWRAHVRPVDTRLVPGRADESEYLFPIEADRVRVRLLYRRFWPEVAEVKGWPGNESSLIDRTWPASAAE